MSHPIPSTLQRIGAVAGCGTAVILLINAAKRADVIPTTALTQLVAPLAQILALPLVLYAVGAVPVALRAFVPEAALDLGLVTMAVGVGWLAIWLFNRSSRITATADHAGADLPMVERTTHDRRSKSTTRPDAMIGAWRSPTSPGTH